MVRLRNLRWIRLLLAVVLPLQFASVAIAAYCQHEHATEEQQHFGHHGHAHDASAGHDDGAASSHSDCDLTSSLSLKVSVDRGIDLGGLPSARPDVVASPLVATRPPDALFRPPLARRS